MDLKVWHVDTTKYYSALKIEGNLAFCNNKGGPGKHHVKWNKPDTERKKTTAWSHL